MSNVLREIAATALSALLRPGVEPEKKKKAKEAAYHLAEAGDLKPNAAFKRQHGILSKAGKAKPEADRVDSDWGLPMPPKKHPRAVRYAHAVLSRAHQATKYDPADVKKQVRKANVVLYGVANPTDKQKADHAKKHAKAKESAARLREWFPTNPPGSWERISSAIQKAAQDSELFGGPANDDPKLNGEDTVRSWDIYVYASFPEKSAVYIANSKTGKMWAARFACDNDENVEFSKVVPVEIALKAAEAMRKRAIVVAKESAASGTTAKLREYLGIAPKGSWERNSQVVSAAAKLDPQFGAANGNTWSIGIYATYPDKSLVIVSNTDTGQLFAAKYEIDDEGVVTFPVVKGADASVTIKEALRKRTPARPRESANPPKPRKIAEAFHFPVRVKEATVDDKGARVLCIMLQEGPGNAHDGHYYTGECIEEVAASGIFEGKQTFCDHPDELEERTRPERTIRDLLGWWGDVHAESAEDGTKLLVGTFYVETGNDFALNKLREAKRFQEKYPNDPDKQYVGFSIYAGGVSELREIGGTEYKAVLQITEAGSTDMVTRAGAKGRMVSLQEAMTLAKTSNNGARESKDALTESVKKLLTEMQKNGKTATLTEAAIGDAVTAALAEAKVEIDDKHVDGIRKAIAKHIGSKIMGTEDPDVDAPGAKNTDDEEEEDDSTMGEGATGDDDIDSLLGDDDEPDEDDADPDEDDADMAAKKKKEAAAAAVLAAKKLAESAGKPGAGKVAEAERLAQLEAKLTEAQAENKKLKAREALRVATAMAHRICKEKNVPRAARPYVIGELLECKNEKAMNAHVGALMEGVRAMSESGVTGVPQTQRIAESNGKPQLMKVSGVES